MGVSLHLQDSTEPLNMPLVIAPEVFLQYNNYNKQKN